MAASEIDELKIREDINHSLKIYVVEELDTEEEVREGLEIINDLSKKFRHCHVELKSELENYSEVYPDYDKISNKLISFIKDAKRRLKVVKSSESSEKSAAHDQERIEMFIVEEQLLTLKISQFEGMIDISYVQNTSAIDEYLPKMEGFLNEYFELSRSLKFYLGEKYHVHFGPKFELKTHEMRDDMKMAKILKQRLLEITERKKCEMSTKTMQKKALAGAKNLCTEIDIRCEFLEKEFDKELESLTDYQILEISQNKNLDVDFNGILEKVTALGLLASKGNEVVQNFLDIAILKRDTIAAKRKLFHTKLETILKSRDVTPDKLRNASTLKVEIPKFSGYDCSIDFYTFKSEFQKLVEPTVQKAYWADYLKRNYLSGMALTLVEKEKEYVKIWEKLKDSYGNARLLLQNKLGGLGKIGLWTIKGEEKIAGVLANLINAMKDLSTLASEHDIEGQLYEGGGLEKILGLVGNGRHRKFRTENLETRGKKDEWEKLLKFLERELKIREKMVLDNKTSKLMGIDVERQNERKDSTKADKWPKSANYGIAESKCHFCDKANHTVITTRRGNKIIPYYVCETFVKMTPEDRLKKLRSKNLCTGCLYPGAIIGPKHKCIYTNFCCPHEAHDSTGKLHVLLCGLHKGDGSNVKLLTKFKETFIENCKTMLPQFSNQISCFSDVVGISTFISQNSNPFDNYTTEPEVTESAIFKLQTIDVGGVKLNIFFDCGCGEMIVRKSAIDKLAPFGRAKQIVPGPITLSGVGGQTSVCEEGAYTICLPLFNGNQAVLTGLCLPKITNEFPVYELNVVEKDIRKECKKVERNRLRHLPKLAEKVGGQTDILIGTKYNKYFPNSILKLSTGLEIFKSVFVSSCGSRGVVGGPHPEFSKAEKLFEGMHVDKAAYTCGLFHETAAMIRNMSILSDGMPLLGIKHIPSMHEYEESICCPVSDFICCPASDDPICCPVSDDPICCPVSDDPSCCPVSDSKCDVLECPESRSEFDACVGKRSPKCVRQFDLIEKAGTEVSYRCPDCRDCPKCKNSERVDAISIQEEVEQDLIERNVFVDAEKGVTSCRLPFLADPDSRLASNEYEALKVLRQVTRKLTTNERIAVIESEKKLQDLGFVDFVDNLSDEEKSLIMKSDSKNFIPWRPNWNEDSVTTSCRLVFDASRGTKGGCSLNSLLPKGRNGMNKLIEIMIRFSTCPHAFHTDISKMYNAVRLDKAHWKYQLYLWSDGLMEDEKPRWKVIKTIIYGVRPSGNIAECGLRRTAELSRDEYPKAYDVVMHDTYVDDCMSGTESLEMTLQVTDELQATVAKGGFTLKGFAMTGENPPEKLSADKESVLVGGMKWFPKGDFASLNIKELNFNKKFRGKKSCINIGEIPENLTKRDCVSKSSEIFDLTGKISPITAGLKLDISGLHQRSLDWDDPIPNELKNVWIKNFDLIQELKELKFHRAVIPVDAVSLDCETIDTGDAGENMICSAIYARYKRRNGQYSCQLIFSRTKIIHDLTIPRAELAAAMLNASTGHIVRLSLKNMHKKCWKISDSQVALHWINCTKNALKIWVRSRVVEITRLTDRSSWHYVASKNMIADLGTRKGATIAEVGPNSPWIMGYPWMRGAESEFPLTKSSELSLSKKEKNEANNEKVLPDISHEEVKCLVTKYVPNEVGPRYKFSRYLVDPNKYRFRTVVRILSLVFLFLHKLSKKGKKLNFLETFNFFDDVQGKGVYVVNRIDPTAFSSPRVNVVVVHLSESMLSAAKKYFFTKATLEVKRFVDPRKYENKSVLKNGILYYTGRILASQKIDGKINLSDVCLDLSANSFIVPITDALSPVAYAIVSETHWYHPDVNHGGVESVLRLSQSMAYIIGGRTLVKSIQKGCTKCRILKKKGIEIAMGPVSDSNLVIAPAFYSSQVDICGPFSAYSPLNKRGTLKVYYVVFCCTATGAADCRIMENYSTDAFIAAFVRFSCRFGYPKVLLPDEGSQLVKGCEDMIISFSDVKNRLSVEYGVEYKTCPVGAHNVHGKVERKIQDIKRSLNKSVGKNRLSVLQWETLGQQIANSINNLPIGLGNKTEMLENIDILTPNRLILGRNNCRCPTAPLELKSDVKRILENNNNIFEHWFKEWLVSYVPNLIEKPKWFRTERNLCVGDVVLFLKSEQEFDRLYQYGIVSATVEGRDGVIRAVEVEYQNPGEKSKRRTKRGVRELVVVHLIDEIGISKELHELAC